MRLIPRKLLRTLTIAAAISLIAHPNETARAADARPFPEPGSKKGLQVQMIDDALALGIKHAALNVSIGSLIDLEQHPENPTWVVDGKTYAFRRGYLDHLGVKPLSDAGVNVYLILLGYETGRPELDHVLLHPNRAAKLPNGIAAINTVTEDGARLWRATVEFLADWFSRANDEHGRVAGYIIGNEVNTHREWNNFGPMPREQAVADYLREVRIAHTAIRRASANARVYISLTHHWTLEPFPRAEDGMPGRVFLDLFASQARAGGDFDWHVAYHPYPENLGNPRVWEDRSATASPDSPRITFRNLEQLPAYLERPEFLCHGQRRRLILSEQGFHSDGTPDGRRGERAQAAAFCYAWEKVARLPGVDAFFLHRHVDHRHEGGLNLGLWRRKPDSVATPDTRKPIYDCFKAAGTPAQAEAFAFALPFVGLSSWDELLKPGK
jgi:hypothetical protein